MLKLVVCGVMLTAFGSAAGAGELDRETAPPSTGVEKSPSATTAVAAGSEMDSDCLLYTSPSPRDGLLSRMPSSA